MNEMESFTLRDQPKTLLPKITNLITVNQETNKQTFKLHCYFTFEEPCFLVRAKSSGLLAERTDFILLNLRSVHKGSFLHSCQALIPMSILLPYSTKSKLFYCSINLATLALLGLFPFQTNP